MKYSSLFVLFSLIASIPVVSEPLTVPSYDEYTQERADRFWNTATNGALAPVYAPLAEWLVQEFQLKEQKGIGIDLGGGPGIVSTELAKRTDSLFWINADINTFFIPYVHRYAEKAGVAHRVSAVFAGAQALPFRDEYAVIIVSRGSFPFWENQQLAFAEIYRVLKPGGIACIGRGLSENLPVETARKVRTKQKGGPEYNMQETEEKLRGFMKELGITTYQIHKPQPPNSEGINYGIWIEFHKKKQ